MTMPPPEKLDVQPVEDQQSGTSEFFSPLHRLRNGWIADHLNSILPNKGAAANHRSVATGEWLCTSPSFLTHHQALTAAVAELLR